MKKILFSFSLLLICFGCINVSAIDACTTSEMTRLRELASNVNFSYQYSIEDELESDEKVVGYYKLQVLNLDDDLRIYYRENNELEYYTQAEIEEMEFTSGKKVFYIYSYTDNYCTDEILRTVTVELPVYNPYYHFNKEKCEEYPDFEYCQEFLDIGDLEFFEIDQLFEEYIDTGIIDLITDSDYRLYFIIGGVSLVLIIAVICFIIVKRKRKKDDI